MENANEMAKETGPTVQSPYPPMGISPVDLLRQDPRYRSPVLATLMSIVPGLGQIYVGYYQQGFINIVVIAGLITMLAHDAVSGYLKPFLAIFLTFYWFFNLVDAYRKSTFYNQALLGLGALQFPDGERLPGSRGSLIGGALLVIIGVIALSYTLFGISIDWLAQWWPLGLILMGVFLLYQALAPRKQQAS